MFQAPDLDGARAQEIARGLAQVQSRITTACAAAGRAPEEVTLIVVTKTYPASDLGVLSSLGVRDVGENRDQEAGPKADQLSDLDLRWHFIGQLQTNKAKSVVRYASVVHSVDRTSLAVALGKAASGTSGRGPAALDCLIQVSLDGDTSRGGAPIGEVWNLGDLIAAQDGLRLAGVMAVAPLGADPNGAFATLHEVSARLQALHPGADVISAGMSGDLESAIGQGATHLRVGGAVLGQRPPLGYGRNAETE